MPAREADLPLDGVAGPQAETATPRWKYDTRRYLAWYLREIA
jgi:hypothetical protein